MLSCGANVVMLSFGANVIIWCYLVMLSSGMITPPFFTFPENFTHSSKKQSSIFDITNTCCNLQQNLWKEVVMDINGLILYEAPPLYVRVSATEGQILSFCSSLRP
jgi:hypothetical protein